MGPKLGEPDIPGRQYTTLNSTSEIFSTLTSEIIFNVILIEDLKFIHEYLSIFKLEISQKKTS